MSKSREQVNEYLKGLEVSGKNILEFGAGTSDQWVINKIKRGWVSYENSDVIDGCSYKIDLNEPSIASYYPETKGDLVFALEVFEHLWNPVEALKNLYDFTYEGGRVIISTPFINPIHDHVDYLRYTFQWYEKVGKMVGFKNVTVTTRYATFKNELHEFYSKEGMRMSKVAQAKYGSHHIDDIGYIVELTR